MMIQNINSASCLPKGQVQCEYKDDMLHMAQTRYHLGNKQKIICHGKLKFKMSASGFEDARTFIDEINYLVKGMALQIHG